MSNGNDRRDEIRSLKRALEERDRSLAELLGSTSWRVTRPLRRLAEILRGARRPWPPAPEEPEAAEVPAPAAAIHADEALYEAPQPLPIGHTDVRLIAFYLPQFHPIPENDRFWGKGFTEWTNTSKARPLFEGHYQPRLPGELGFYDLRVAEVQARQIELARQFGVHGFCFHYYWFNGKRVLDLPLRRLLGDPSLDFPFCLNWANEPWTARWDGVREGGGVLIPQDHSPEDDIAFLDGIRPALTDPRYIRVQGRPLLSVYRPGLFPDMRATAERWREHAARSGIGELYLALVQNVYDAVVDPREHGFDAAIEFPPAVMECVDVRDQVEPYAPGQPENVYSYPEVVRCGLNRPQPDYTLLRGIMPGWDNTPRRRDATLYLGSTPDLYESWLEGLCRHTRSHHPPEERLIFVNAWNEWAEGAYLEPDRRYGYAYLNRTARALRRHARPSPRRKLLLVGHDAARAGAQILLLDLARWLATRTATELRILLGRGGDLVDAYSRIADVVVLEDLAAATDAEVVDSLRGSLGEDFDLIYANSAASGRILPHLSWLNAPIVTHVHELEESLRRFAGADVTREVVRTSARLIAASPPVRSNLIDSHQARPDAVDLVHSFIRPREPDRDPTSREGIRASLGASRGEILVFGCGTRDWRKGPDLFVEVAAAVRERGLEGVRFAWIGAEIEGQYPDLETGLAARGLDSTVRFVGSVDDPSTLMAAGDLFLLPSREDPFPLVCLEAAACGLPTICFAAAGGMPDFVEPEAGIVVPHEDTEAMADAVERLVSDADERKARGAAARRKLLERHTTDVAAPEIFHIIRSVSSSSPLVSVVVPNFNYAHHLDRRLQSIFDQTFQDFEILVQDDGSNDESLEVLGRHASRRNLRVSAHPQNRGVFEMWRQGIDQARGELIWVAEADDLCEPDFLETLVTLFEDPSVKLAYCQTIVIDDQDRPLGDYTLAFPDLSSRKWLAPYRQSLAEELADGLAIKNFLVNASAVVFRKPRIEELDDFPGDFRVAGDWYLYLRVLEGGDVAYSPAKLNRHRRHDGSVIASVAPSVLAAELGRIHSYVLKQYAPDEVMVERMARYALGAWRRANPEDSLESFWRVYGVHMPASIRGLLSESA